eukprot:TRINITY_DN29489_c3_g1_i1.p1 TRINITY_DN29489_c3_g1~~TRINITY_DN29489_c3_g1_i1.p1  ORF type:complete len:1201 (+),score=198.36 TRINITY_DN29489_c3_g1_i1:71-3604(+)
MRHRRGGGRGGRGGRGAARAGCGAPAVALLLLGPRWVATQLYPSFNLCKMTTGMFVYGGTLQNQPCPRWTYSAAPIGDKFLFACFDDGAVLCDGDGSGPAPASCSYVGKLGCPSFVYGAVASAAGDAVYAACRDDVRHCQWDAAAGAASSCSIVSGALCPGGGYESSVAVFGTYLVLACWSMTNAWDAGILACPLAAPGGASVLGTCQKQGADPCGTISGTYFRNFQVSLDAAGGMSVGCRTDGAAYCSAYSTAGGPSGCGTVSPASPCSSTMGWVLLPSGQTAVSCDNGGYRLCGRRRSPTGAPTAAPTAAPKPLPTGAPSAPPSESPLPPPTGSPSSTPTGSPSSGPTQGPTGSPTTSPIKGPSPPPSRIPSAPPTQPPSPLPSPPPSQAPSAPPTQPPSGQPSARPSSRPSAAPSTAPSRAPSPAPTESPSAAPSARPSPRPSAPPSPSPTGGPSGRPSARPSAPPSPNPTGGPSRAPTRGPSRTPSAAPSPHPSRQPTAGPSAAPTLRPSALPSGGPTPAPSGLPSAGPSRRPSLSPSQPPSRVPSQGPSLGPSGPPSPYPSARPSAGPTAAPSAPPRLGPTAPPTAAPLPAPSRRPSGSPTAPPTPPGATPPPTATPEAEPQAPSAAPTGSLVEELRRQLNETRAELNDTAGKYWALYNASRPKDGQPGRDAGDTLRDLQYGGGASVATGVGARGATGVSATLARLVPTGGGAVGGAGNGRMAGRAVVITSLIDCPGDPSEVSFLASPTQLPLGRGQLAKLRGCVTGNWGLVALPAIVAAVLLRVGLLRAAVAATGITGFMMDTTLAGTAECSSALLAWEDSSLAAALSLLGLVAFCAAALTVGRQAVRWTVAHRLHDSTDHLSWFHRLTAPRIAWRAKPGFEDRVQLLGMWFDGYRPGAAAEHGVCSFITAAAGAMAGFARNGTQCAVALGLATGTTFVMLIYTLVRKAHSRPIDTVGEVVLLALESSALGAVVVATATDTSRPIAVSGDITAAATILGMLKVLFDAALLARAACCTPAAEGAAAEPPMLQADEETPPSSTAQQAGAPDELDPLALSSHSLPVSAHPSRSGPTSPRRRRVHKGESLVAPLRRRSTAGGSRRSRAAPAGSTSPRLEGLELVSTFPIGDSERFTPGSNRSRRRQHRQSSSPLTPAPGAARFPAGGVVRLAGSV